MRRRRKTWQEEFRQHEADALRYLELVRDAWLKRERLGITPIEHGGGKYTEARPRLAPVISICLRRHLRRKHGKS